MIMGISTKLAIGAFAGAMTFGGAAQAATVIAATNELQTVAGESFNLSLLGLGPSDGTGGTLSIYARGDYEDFGTDSEFLNVDAEGLFTAGPLGSLAFDATTNVFLSGSGGPFDFAQKFGSNDAEFQRTFALSGALLDALLGDGQVDVGLQLSDPVDIITADSRVNIILKYESASETAVVPLPASLPLLLAGLAGFGVLRRRAKS